MESRMQPPTVKLGRKDTWGLRKSRGCACHGALTRKVPDDFLREYSASWIRKQSHSLREYLTIHGATHSPMPSFIHSFIWWIFVKSTLSRWLIGLVIQQPQGWFVCVCMRANVCVHTRSNACVMGSSGNLESFWYELLLCQFLFGGINPCWEWSWERLGGRGRCVARVRQLEIP